MIVEPKVREFICTTAHPQGCKENVREQIAYVKEQGITGGPKIQCLCGFRHLHLCTREKYRASENRFHLYIGTNEKT